MPRPDPSEYGSFYQTYIDYTRAADYSSLVGQHNHQLVEFWSAIPIEKINYAYTPEKWTIKQMLQHVIDTERIFAFRALVIARNERQAIPGFDENEYANNATAVNRNWKDMLVEWGLVRQSTNLLFASFTDAQLKCLGFANNQRISVNALGFIIIGHALHHLTILKERYGIKATENS